MTPLIKHIYDAMDLLTEQGVRRYEVAAATTVCEAVKAELTGNGFCVYICRKDNCDSTITVEW